MTIMHISFANTDKKDIKKSAKKILLHDATDLQHIWQKASTLTKFIWISGRGELPRNVRGLRGSRQQGSQFLLG